MINPSGHEYQLHLMLLDWKWWVCLTAATVRSEVCRALRYFQRTQIQLFLLRTLSEIIITTTKSTTGRSQLKKYSVQTAERISTDHKQNLQCAHTLPFWPLWPTSSESQSQDNKQHQHHQQHQRFYEPSQNTTHSKHHPFRQRLPYPNGNLHSNPTDVLVRFAFSPFNRWDTKKKEKK